MILSYLQQSVDFLFQGYTMDFSKKSKECDGSNALLVYSWHQ